MLAFVLSFLFLSMVVQASLLRGTNPFGNISSLITKVYLFVTALVAYMLLITSLVMIFHSKSEKSAKLFCVVAVVLFCMLQVSWAFLIRCGDRVHKYNVLVPLAVSPLPVAVIVGVGAFVAKNSELITGFSSLALIHVIINDLIIYGALF